MKNLLALILIFFCTLTLPAQELLRYPALSPDGTQLAFSYQGDIWTVAANGGDARRLTIHESYASNPKWSPDGQKILFEANRYGNNDLFVISANGADLKQLTYYSGNDDSGSWGANGAVLFSTRRGFAQVERESEIYQLDQNTATPYRALDALGYMPSMSPDGRYIAFTRGSCRIAREAYTGPANKDLWLYDRQTKTYNQITTHTGQDIYPDWGNNNTLYFLSARSGRYNLHKLTIENGKAKGAPEALTSYKDEGIRYFDVSHNGETAVLEKGNQILRLDLKSGSRPAAVKIGVTKDYRFDPVEQKNYSQDASEFALSPDGKLIAFSVRGEIFVYPSDKDKKRARRLTNHPGRDYDLGWLNDTTLLFRSDRNGNYDIFAVSSADTSEVSLYKTLKLKVEALTNTPQEENGLLISPKKDKVAFRRDRGQLVVADIASDGTISNEKILHNSWSTPSDLSWSPDGKWLAYALDDLNFNQEVYIHAADNSQKPVNVSLHPRSDNRPVWSADGSKLGFLSERNNGDWDVWFVWLSKEDWEKTKRDWEEDEDKEEKKGKSSKKDTSEMVMQIDFEDIHERLQQITHLPGNEGNLAISPDGETFYFSTNGGGRQGGAGKRAFMKVKWDGTEDKELLSNKALRSLEWDNKGKSLYLLDTRGAISNMNAESGKSESIGFQAKLDIDHIAERRQVFDEAWRALNLGFYDPGFHGQNFSALRQKYEAMALSASTSQDFRDIFNEMLGQLNASHMGMYGSNPEQTQRNSTGMLGLEVVPDVRGVKITAIITDTPADRKSSQLEVGEIIQSVNQEAITANTNFYRLFEGTTNERTLLSVIGKDGTSREVVIRPTGSINQEVYEAWVDERKRLTDQYSNGQLGYIHIRGMNWSSFERFERELAASGQGKKGIVIDVRFNGGGWTTDMLLTILNVRQHSYTIPRGAARNLDKEHQSFNQYYPYGERLPFSALIVPSVTLCNENSYSNAEIFSHAYKQLGHGTLVGQPTFGAVISTGGQGLVDGSFVRMPYRAWYVKATGENMEHGPAVPDILVENAPDSKAKGEDPQLKKAVEVLLGQVGKE